VNRRAFLYGMGSLALLNRGALTFTQRSPVFHLLDITQAAGIDFRHNSGAYGAKFLPETLGPGCAFLDYDQDGWQDILLINGMDWPGHRRQYSTMHLYRNNRNGTFSDVTRQAGLAVEMYGMGAAVGDYNNDGFPDIFVTCVGQNRLFRNTGKGSFVDATQASGLAGRHALSTSAVWFDFDRDGHLDLFVCNYVKWSEEHDVFCSLDCKHKSYCTPEAYHGETCWLFHNRGDGTFEDATASSGIFDTSSKSLGVAIIDHDQDGWPDLLVTNDTQPNKLYRNEHNGQFKDIALEAAIAFSADGRARAGMGVDVGDFENSGRPGVAITNFDNEMIGLYRASKIGLYQDIATQAGVGLPSKTTLGFGCLFADLDLDGHLDLIAANGHIDDTVRNIRHNVAYAQAPQIFLNTGQHSFRDESFNVGADFRTPKIGRGLAYSDFDLDGDLDLLMTTNNGPAYLYRNDHVAGNRSIRFHLIGTQSNRDALGAAVRLYGNGMTQLATVKSGSSYLSQSELPVTFGVGPSDLVERAVIQWPSGRWEEYKKLRTGHSYRCTEGSGITDERQF